MTADHPSKNASSEIHQGARAGNTLGLEKAVNQSVLVWTGIELMLSVWGKDIKFER